MFLWYSKQSIDLSYKLTDLFYILKYIFCEFIFNSSEMESISNDEQQCKAKCFKKKADLRLLLKMLVVISSEKISKATFE